MKMTYSLVSSYPTALPGLLHTEVITGLIRAVKEEGKPQNTSNFQALAYLTFASVSWTNTSCLGKPRVRAGEDKTMEIAAAML